MKRILFLLVLLVAISFPYIGNALECMDCHKWDMGSYPAINASLFGSHIDINTTGGTGNLTSDDCTSCHYDTSQMYSGGFTVSTYTCEDCHINGAVPSTPRIYNHNRNAGISVNAFCSDCHDKTSNLYKYSANASAAHYGRNSSFGLSTGEQYCIFCHQNSSTVYKDVMQNPDNNRVSNHTSGIIFAFHPAGKPSCTSCHGQDRIHGTNINKPVPSSGFCNGCHSSDGLQKNMHNGKVECIRCHTDTPWDIHDIKYVLSNGSYLGINATGCADCHDFGFPAPYFRLPFSAADCTACHQSGGLIRFSEAPRIPTPMRHSTNPYSGALWNGSQPVYWSNISQQSACNYCHGNTLHAPKALGKIENIRSGNAPNQSIKNTSYWCANCHYMSSSTRNYSYNGSSFSPVPPEIQDKTGLVPGKANDGTTFFNHSITAWSDNVCLPCHSVTSSITTASFVHNVAAGGGGADCTSCHDINATGAPPDRRIDILAFNRSVHYSLNGGGNRACWACHGDGTEPNGHPAEYKSPKRCSNDECHSLDQKYRAPMIYSHFQNASLNGNPNNATNYNITVSAQCQACHINSVVKTDNSPDIALVSHYGSKDNLVDSFNCAYCHLDKDNSENWGTATLINKNRTGLVALERERNRFTVNKGDSAYLGGGYFLKLVEVSANADEAIIQILKNDITVDEVSLGIMTPYEYDEKVIIDNSTLKIPAITLNITSIFGGNNSFIQFEGYRSRKIHTDKESKDSACYACHLYRYSGEKERYLVIDKETKESYDEIYYTKVLVDFNPENRSKIYSADDDYVFSQLWNYSGKYLSVPDKKKYLKEGETWNIADDYSLKVNEVSTDSKEAWLTLMINGRIAESKVIPLGSSLEYTPGIRYKAYTETNVTVFTAKITDISQGPNFIILGDVVALSPDIMKITSNVTLFGYNTSWLKPNDTFAVGRIPPDLHAPNLYNNRKNWADCVSCHDTSKNLGIPDLDAISSRLGKHSELNDNASNKAFLSDPIDKACWACHTGGTEPQMHSPTYVAPRDCKSCHIYQKKPFFGAIYVGDEPHGNQSNCGSCHIEGTHTLKRFQVTPVVKGLVISKKEINMGETVNITAEAVAGYGMRIRAVEYFLDKTGIPGNGTSLKPLDGAFNSQVEQVTAELNTTNISTGTHIIYIRAMERNNRWGDFSQVNFSITSGGAGSSKALENARVLLNSIPFLNLIYLLLSLAAAYFIVLGFIRR